MKIWQKTIAILATFALLLNSLSAPLIVLAQEETPSPTPETITEPSTSDTTVEETATPEATPEVTPSEIATPTPEVTPVATNLETPTPTDQPVVTQAPESNPTTTSPPASTEPSSTPIATPTISPVAQTETGTLSATVLKDETLTTSALDQFDVTYQTDGSANISTDKLDYSPTDTAVISGVGFTPDKTYTINITSSDSPAVDFSAPVTTNDKGEIFYPYTLDGSYRPSYQVKIKDEERVAATTSFTDSSFYGNIQIIESSNDSGLGISSGWDFTIVGLTTNSVSNLHNGSSSLYKSFIGLYTVTETPHTGTNALNYNTSYKCVNGSTVVTGDSGLITLFTLSPNQNIVCTFTNTIKTGTISGKVWNDLNGNGIQNSNEPALNNWPVKLCTDSSCHVVAQSTNTVNGFYSFTAPFGVSYYVFEDEPASWSQTYPAFSLLNGFYHYYGPLPIILSSIVPSIGNLDFGNHDITPPVIAYNVSPAPDVNGWNNSDPTVTWTVSDPESPVTTTGCQTQTITTDTSGLTITCSATSSGGTNSNSVVIKLDTTPPAVPTGIYFKDTVNNKDVACGGITSARNFDVYWNANTEPDFDHYEYTSYNADGNTGLVDQPFTTNYFNASWWTVPTEGTYGVQIRSVDQLGNKSAWSGGAEGYNNSCKYTADWTAPTVHFVFPTPGPSAISFKAVFSENVNLTEATDPANYFLNNWPGYGGSGDLGGHADISYDPTTYTATVSFTTPGWYVSPEQEWGVENIHDLAGNLLSVSPYHEYSTPMVAPVTTDSGTDENWHSTPVTITLSCTDVNGSGCKNTYYTTNGDDPTTSSLSGNSVTLSSDRIYTIKYFSIDNAGNIEDIKNATNTVKIDTIAPTTPVADPPAGNYLTSQSVTLSSSDSGSGLANIFYTTDGSTPSSTSALYTGPITVDYDTTINAIAYDNVGNASNILTASYGIAPVVSGESGIGVSYTSATVTWTTDRPATSRVVYDIVPHPTIDSNDPNYGYPYSTTEDSTKVLNHSVTIYGLSAGTVYYYRVISHGSPTAIGGEQALATLSVAGAPASSGSSGGAAVLGISTSAVTGWPELAYAPETGSGNNNVLGASTSATPSPKPEASNPPVPIEPAKVSVFRWILTHKKIDLGILLILLAISYGIYQIAKKKK